MGHAEKVEPEISGDRVGRHVSETASHGVPHVGRGRTFADIEETARKGDDHVKGKRASVGERADIVKRHPGGALDELVTEATLSRPRLRGHQDDPRSTGLRLAKSLLEPSELVLAADEGREGARPGDLQAAPDLARPPQLEHAHGSAGALETVFATVAEVEEARREAGGVLGQSDAAWWRQLLHPGGEPDHVPLRGV